MADTLISQANLVFGITDTAALGYFESLEFENVSDKLEVKDGDGDIIGIDYFARRYTVTGTYVFNTSNAVPVTGTSITITAQTNQMSIGANAIYLDTVKQSYANADVTKIEFTGTTYPSIT